MIDTTLVAYGYAFLVLAGVAGVAAIAAIVATVRDLRSTPAPYVITFSTDTDVRRAA